MKLKCCKCKQLKKPSDFYKNRSKKTGRSDTCILCQNAYGREHYKKNKQYYKDKARRREIRVVATLRQAIDKLKNVPCTDCGKRFPPCAMDFDHIRHKTCNVANMPYRKYSLDRVHAEIKKCEVVCACCHRVRTKMRRHSVTDSHAGLRNP